MKTGARWHLELADLNGLDAVKARDLVIECFFQAQKETLARAKRTLGQAASDAETKRATASIVKAVFREIGADFDRPDKPTLARVVELLAQRSDAWGTPADIIDHHREQLRRLLRVL